MCKPVDSITLTAIQGLLQTMRTLRSPEGCDWDRHQSPTSLKKYILEEAYEVIDAIDRGEPAEICDELGDLLLQVVFQAQIFEEQGEFGMAEIAESIDSKLKRRHPHIFASANPANREFDWERIKKEERSAKGQSLHLSSRIPQALPALKRADKLVSYHARENKQPRSPSTTNQKIKTDLAELASATDKKSAERQVGDILYQMAVLSRELEIDAEEALRQSVDRRINNHDAQQRA